jgi:hypothetical protein
MKAEIEGITTFCALFAACMVLLGKPVALMCLAGWRRLSLARVIPFWICLIEDSTLSSASLLSYLCVVSTLRKEAHKSVLLCLEHVQTHQMRNWEWKFYTNRKRIGTQIQISTNFGDKLSLRILSFLFLESACLDCYYIYFRCVAPTFRTFLFSFEPCALNVEFQYFILRFDMVF